MSRTRTVLMVEDDPAIVELYSLRLRLDGFRVVAARDEAGAEGMFASERPDVACVDVHLGRGAGVALAERFATAGCAVILLTNDQNAFDRAPAAVAMALIKARTSPGQLALAVAGLIPDEPDAAAG